MSEKDDDSVEKFFRQADASRFDTDYNENDWRKMEEMLDRENERVAALKKKKLTNGAIAAVLLIAFSVSWYVIREDAASEGSNAIVSASGQLDSDSTESNSNEDNLEATSTQEESNLTNEARRSPSVNKSETNSANEKLTDNENKIPESDQNKILTGGKKSENNRDGQATPSKQHDVKANENDVSTNTDVTKAGVVLSGVSGKSIGETTQIPEVMKGENNQPVVSTNGNQGDPLQNADKNSILVDSADVKEVAILLAGELNGDEDAEEGNKESGKNYGRWMVSFAVAPDFSRTTKSGYDSPGGAIGVFVHYQFLKRWSVSTGVLRSDKKYWGYGDEYNPPYGYWEYVTNGVVPEKVDGNCLVLEVPLSLAYNFVETRRSRVFVTAGISSYFMRSEKYEYTFDEPNPGSPMGWSTDEPSSYLFGIGSLSVGYDFRVSPTLSFGLEPYYRIPFAEVGWANIDLYSLGFLFNARYRFLKKEHLSSPPGVLK